jgi:CRISPR-associated protein Cas2
MEILVVYDVSTTDSAGPRRLRHVAKLCEAHGQRVQKSVFECILNEGQVETFWHRLTREIDESLDSIRMYRLREPHRRFTFMAGRQPEFDLREPLVL